LEVKKGKNMKQDEFGCLNRQARTARNKPNLKYAEDFALEGSTERHEKEEIVIQPIKPLAMKEKAESTKTKKSSITKGMVMQ
jgi:hypothetical protein